MNVPLKLQYLKSLALSLETIFEWARKLVEDMNKWGGDLIAAIATDIDAAVAAEAAARDAAIAAALAALYEPPVGARMLWYSLTPPTGWVLGNGQSLDVVDYPELFALIGYAFGGAGTSFNVRDDLTADGLQTIVRAS